MLFQDDGYEFVVYDTHRAMWRDELRGRCAAPRATCRTAWSCGCRRGAPGGAEAPLPEATRQDRPQVMIFSNGDLSAVRRSRSSATAAAAASRRARTRRARSIQKPSWWSAQSRERRRRRGFTLIEVLVALAIVAVGMAAVLGALSLLGRHHRRTCATRPSRSGSRINRIATLRLSGQAPADRQDRRRRATMPAAMALGPGGGERPRYRASSASTSRYGPRDVKAETRTAAGSPRVSGIWGDAVGIPNGYQPDWGAQLPRGAPRHSQHRQPRHAGGAGHRAALSRRTSPRSRRPPQPPQLTNPNQNQ